METTHDDGLLMIQILRWGEQMALEEALSFIFSDQFDRESEDVQPSVRKVLVFGETVGAFVKHGLIGSDLVKDIFWFDGMWDRVGHHALAARAQEDEPSLYENFEALAGIVGGTDG
jgi:hypothetical protein